MKMLAEFVSKILSLGTPNFHSIGDLEYSDKRLDLIYPPSPEKVECSTLQGLVDLHEGELDDAKGKGDLLVHITSPTSVSLISRESDAFGRRRVWAKSIYPECKTFGFGSWMDPETFIISAQAHFQRVKIEYVDGSFAKDLDYVLSVASKITAEHSSENADDGFAQRVAVKQGITLKAETVLQPVVNLAPYRTFAEIDQAISAFVFRARINNGSVVLALFEGDGGRWKLDAIAAIKKWLQPKFGDVPVIS
jgi:hypothetical protein